MGKYGKTFSFAIRVDISSSHHVGDMSSRGRVGRCISKRGERQTIFKGGSSS